MNNEYNENKSIDIFKAIQLAGIFIGKDISIEVNDKINHFERIKKLFDNRGISYECYTPSAGKPKRFDLHFGIKTDYQDLYIIIAILKNFGLQSVFLREEDDNNKVLVGSYITEFGLKKDDSEGINPNKILELPFTLSTNEFLKECFGFDKINENSSDSEEELFEDNDDYVGYEDNYYYYDDYGSSYQKYGGYNGYSDDVIDDAFEGDPMNTWNVD